MKVRILGCSGGVNRNVATTSFFIDDDILIDAGSGVCSLSVDQMRSIKHIFITHSHLDHIASIPLLADTLFEELKNRPITVYGLPETLSALQQHIFNWVIWPDFTRLPEKDGPVLKMQTMLPGETIEINGRSVEMVQVNHVVPGAGYLVRQNGHCFAFSGDTTTNDTFWDALNKLSSLDLLIVETAFANEDRGLAELARHYCPDLLAQDLKKLNHDTTVCITHLKPGYEEQIMQQCEAAVPNRKFHRLDTGQVFDLGD